MSRGRHPEQVAKRALILGAISFRASLEVTEDSRSLQLSDRLLDWLREMGCDANIDPLERELLATPLGRLGDSLRIDANCAGEAAAVVCWMLKLIETLSVTEPADQSILPEMLSILRPDAIEIIRTATLRDLPQIEDYCRQLVLIRSNLQETRIGPPASEIIRRLNLERLDDVGIRATEQDLIHASSTVTGMTPDARRRASGLCFVREHAALWFFSNRGTFFEQDV